MTESQFSRKLIRALQYQMPRATIWKICDRFASGRPDMEVILEGVATWFELKSGTKYGVTKLQWEILKRLQRGYLVQAQSGKYIVTHATSATVTIHDSFEGLVGRIVNICGN